MAEFGRSMGDLLRRLRAWFAAAILTWLVGFVGLYGWLIAPRLPPDVRASVDRAVNDFGPAALGMFLFVGFLVAYHQLRQTGNGADQSPLIDIQPDHVSFPANTATGALKAATTMHAQMRSANTASPRTATNLSTRTSGQVPDAGTGGSTSGDVST